MALEKTVLSVPFSSGIDEKYQSQLLPQGFQTTVINGVYTKNGSIRKRYGTVALGDNPALVGAQRLGTRQGELFACCQDNGAGNTGLFTYQPDVTGDEWGLINPADQIPQLPPVIATRKGILSGYTVLSQDVVVSGNGGDSTFVTYACRVSGGGSGGGGSGGSVPITQILVFTIDATTGAQTQMQTFSPVTTNLFGPRLINTGPVLILVYGRDDGTIYAASSISSGAMTGGTFGNLTPLANDFAGTSTGVFDADIVGSHSSPTSDFVIAYQSNSTSAPTITLAVARFENDFTPVANSTTVVSTATDMTGIGVSYDSSEHCWVSYSSNSGSVNAQILTYILDPTTLASTASVTTFSTTVFAGFHNAGRIGHQRVDASDIIVVASILPVQGTPTSMVTWQKVHSDGTLVSGRGWQQSVHLMSRPFDFFNHVYVAAFFFGGLTYQTEQPTMYVLGLGVDPSNSFAAQCISTLAPGINTDIQNFNVPWLTKIYKDHDTNTFYFPMNVDAGGITRASMQSAKLELVRDDIWLNTEYVNKSFIMCGTPVCYDGGTVTEVGFLYYPENLTAVAGGGGSGSLSGTYQYLAIFESYDRAGNVKQSAPSTPFEIVLTGSSAIITYPNYSFAVAGSDSAGITNFQIVTVALYRTLEDGDTFYRLTTINPSIDTATNAFNSGSSTYTDVALDATIAQNPILDYANGAELPNNCIPSEAFSCIHLGRLVTCGGDDRTIAFFSKTFIAGFDVGFNDDFTIQFDEEIVAIASLEGQLVAWSNRSIYVVTGNGPDNAGGGDGFSTPQRITSDVGCVEPRSLVTLQDGIMFLSSGGLYMLTRSLEVVYQGHNVEDEISTSDFRDMTSAILLDDEAQQRFGVRYDEGIGKTLVYDDVQKSWSIFTYANPDVVDNVSAVRWYAPGATTPTYVFTDGSTVYQEQESTFLDLGVWVPRTVTTAWIRSQNVQGFVRFWNVIAIGEMEEPNDFTMSFAFNYETINSQTHKWLWTDLSPIVDTTRQQVSMKPYQQKVQAMQVTIVDSDPGEEARGTGSGVTLLSLDFEIGIKKGFYKGLPAAGRF